MIFKNSKAYDILKTIALIIGPLVVFLTALINIWGLPYGTQITATLAAIEAFIGALVTASKHAYNKQQEAEDGKGL